MTRTEKDICKDALQVQDASNIHGVLHSMWEISIELRDLGEDPRAHPAMLLFLDKLDDMLYRPFGFPKCQGELYSNAYQYCKQKSGYERFG